MTMYCPKNTSNFNNKEYGTIVNVNLERGYCVKMNCLCYTELEFGLYKIINYLRYAYSIYIYTTETCTSTFHK